MSADVMNTAFIFFPNDDYDAEPISCILCSLKSINYEWLHPLC